MLLHYKTTLFITLLLLLGCNEKQLDIKGSSEFPSVSLPKDNLRWLQTRVDQLMPLERKKLFLSIVVSNPVVDLGKNSDNIIISADIHVSAINELKGNGTAKISGSISCNNQDGAFYLANPLILSLKINKLPNKFLPKIKHIVQVFIVKALEQYPVYKFKDNNLKHSLAKAVLDSVKVENEMLIIKMSAF